MQLESNVKNKNARRWALWVAITSAAVLCATGNPSFADPQTQTLESCQADFRRSMDELDRLLESLDDDFESTDRVIKPGPSNKTDHSQAPFDPDARTALAFQITPKLSVGGKINLELKLKNNEDLDEDTPDRLIRFESQLSLAALYQPAPDIEIFGEARLSDEESLKDTSGKKKEETLIEFREGYILLRKLFDGPIGIQIGRQKLSSDKRKWLYDERLDAVRVFYKDGPLSGELSISSILVDSDGKENKITNYIAMATYKYAKKSSVSVFGMAREDRGKKDRDPVYFGVLMKGRPHKRQRFWLNSAVMLGHDKKKDLRGFGLDAGWSQLFKHPLKPSITLGFAFGSGDSNPKNKKDREFQQTDLQDNTGRFFGNTKFSYYGEVFDPELSNMMIFTAGVGIVPSKSFSLDIVYHYYTLVELAEELRDASVVENLTGKDKDLGHEIDLILGLKFADNIRGSITAGAFMPGSAFEKNRTAYSTQFKVQISF